MLLNKSYENQILCKGIEWVYLLVLPNVDCMVSDGMMTDELKEFRRKQLWSNREMYKKLS